MVKMGPKGSHLEAETSQECGGGGGAVVREVHTICLSHGVLSAMVPAASSSPSTNPLPVSSHSPGPPSHWHESALLLIVLS